MLLFRALLATCVAIAISNPAFAEEGSNPSSMDVNQQNNSSMQIADNTDATQTATTDAKPAADMKVNVNKATVKELAKLKGMSASKARAIVAYRKKHGDFKSVDDLSNVKGLKKMKPDMMKEITDQMTVE